MIKRLILLPILLAGCSSNVQGSWQCPNPVPRGSHCMNISAADGLVSDNTEEVNPVARQVKSDSKTDKKPNKKKPKESGAQPVALAPDITPQDPVPAKKSIFDFMRKDKTPVIKPEEITEEPEVLTRTPETVARVWFAPFIDKYNNRHEGSFIYVVDQESKWRTE